MSTDDLRKEFCAALDSQVLPKSVDAVVVLRNWDMELTQSRLMHAVDLLHDGYAPVMVMPYSDNTRGEAEKVASLAYETGWASIILVTHRAHHYRAFLTFIQRGLIVYSSPVELEGDEAEFRKIDAYIAKGDIATYSEGLVWLEQQTQRRI